MRGKSTIVLLVLALALGAFIYFYERHTLDTGAYAERAAKLLPEFNPLAVQAVAFTGTNLQLRAERTPRGWRLTAPVAYPAHAERIEDFLRELGELTTRPRVTGAEVHAQAGGLAAFGLKPSTGLLVLELPTNRVEFRLGAVSAAADRMYLQPADGPDVFTAGSNFVARLPRAANQWRDRALLPVEELAFNRVTVRAPGRGFEFERDPTNRLWRLSQPIAARADHAAVEALLQQMRGWQVAGFITDAPTAADLETNGLAAPELELALGDGTNILAAVQFGGAVSNGSDLIFARRLTHSNVVTLPRAAAERLRVPFTEFRERRLLGAAWPVVDQIDVRGEDQFTIRREPAGGWRVTEPLNFAADGATVTNLLLALAELEVAEFVKDVVTDYAPYGLAEPGRSYTLRGGTNGLTTTLRIDFGSNSPAGLVFTRRADEPAVYGVPAGNVARLPSALFELRDRQLWNFSSSNVVGVTVRQGGAGGTRRRLTRDAAREWIVAEGPATPFNPLSVPETLHQLGQLRATRWLAHGDGQRVALGFTPAATLAIELDVAVGEKLQRFAVDLAVPAPGRWPIAATIVEGETVFCELPPEIVAAVARDLTIPPPAPKP